ncbi:MAG: VCBS repeat-containing protein [Alphaproteobacteria bacterium]|nr:VCBS repeat-containing protein [Alphaproteobacteria bacterium]
MQRPLPIVAAVVATAAITLLAATRCGGGTAPEPAPASHAEPAPAAKPTAPAGPLPALILTQARFEKVGGKTVPRPAALWLLRKDGDTWHEEVVEDPGSNVFHKGVWWRDGILTIGAMKARLTHWKHADGTWKPTVLWEQSWGGKFDRLRDVEIADVTGDGKEDLVIATHDMGVVAVGTEQADGTWSFVESEKVPDTFVHEIELGDVDGDGKPEIYATPSDRNRSSGASQQGGVSRYTLADGKLTATPVVHWEESHAKEILVADTDGDGRDELYAVREAHVEVGPDKKKTRLEPVKVVRLDPGASGWTETVVTTLDDDQSRFLTAADVDHDGALELVITGKTSGAWMLERKPDGTFENHQIAADTKGFEHAVHTADLDGDGKIEVYVASDDTHELLAFTWNGSGFDRKRIAAIPDRAITWGIQDGRF